MKLSIIIATYNSSDVIENCLNSILEQTFKDFEVIVIDGASDDDTLEKKFNIKIFR
jgi:glycosyltransferase involved in cell wall biosynthesis